MDRQVFLRTVGAACKARRERLGISVYRLSKDAGVSEPTITDFESGAHSINLYGFVRICKALKLNPWSVMRER